MSFGSDVGRTAVATDKKQFQLSYQKEGGHFHNSKLVMLMSSNCVWVVDAPALPTVRNPIT